MKIDDSMQEKINFIQISEQNLNQLNSQKQSFQSQLVEIEGSLLELSKTKKAYKIIGNIMIETETELLKSDLNSKKEMLDLRLKSIQKQEERIKQKIQDTQKDVMDAMKKK